MAVMENRVCILDCTGETDHSTAARLLSDLTGQSSPPDCSQTVVWRVDNKYYETDISVEVRRGLESGRGESWEALIALSRLSQPISLKSAYSVWEGLESEATPPVNLLVGVVDGCGLVEEVKGEVVQWCLGRGVELVIWETNPPIKDKTEEEDDFPESVGVARVSEALQAHMWPLMTLKDNKQQQQQQQCVTTTSRNGGSPEMRLVSSPLGGSSDHSESTNSHSEEEKTGPAQHSSNPTSSEARLDSLLAGGGDEDHMKVFERADGGSEDDVDDFESLFSRFGEMKAHAESLPHDERKAYAEKVVMSFWKAIEGEEGEINNESDSDHETS